MTGCEGTIDNLAELEGNGGGDDDPVVTWDDFPYHDCVEIKLAQAATSFHFTGASYKVKDDATLSVSFDHVTWTQVSHDSLNSLSFDFPVG
jgi:hypothetical protein